MEKITKTFTAILFAVTILTISCKKDETPVSNEPTANYKKVFRVVDSIRQALQTSSGKVIPSLNVLINTPTEEIFVSSVPQNGVPVTRDTYFRFASNTKNMTSAAILNMQEDGWLHITDKLTDTIPGSAIPYVPATSAWNIPYKNQITIEQLMQHSAGIYDLVNDTVPGCGGKSYTAYIEGLDPNHQFTAGEFANQLRINHLSNFLPGTNWSYTNTGYALLAEVVGRVYTFNKGMAKVYTDYLHDYLVGPSAPVPLGIRFPYLATDQLLPMPFIPSTAYHENGETITYSNCNMSANVSEGNSYGTMRMLNQYIRSLMTGSNILTPASVNLMQTDISPGSTTYALGCAYQKNLGFGHTGSTHGYMSAMFYDPLTGVSVIGMLPVWDFTNGMASYDHANLEMILACYSARMALGYPGYK
jgi:D-alanyl-D-alanine carboxypeptidase